MEIKDIEQMTESLKKKPFKTISVVILFLFFGAVIALIKGYFGEKGKRLEGASHVSSYTEKSLEGFQQTPEKTKARPANNEHSKVDSPAFSNQTTGNHLPYHVENKHKELSLRHNKSEAPRQIINQHTEGEQSPAVNVAPGGQSIINYGAPNDKGTHE